jgi:hypothetical protein
MNRAFTTLSVLFGLSLSGSLLAEPPATTTETPSPPTEPAPSIGADIPRDPKGIKGVSPHWEKVVHGDASTLAQDFVVAQKSYQSAITQEPKNPRGHLRMAELSLKRNELTEAQTFAENALRFAEDDLRAKAQASFLAAEIHERQKMPDEAIADWRAYKALAAELPKPVAHEGKGPTAVRIHEATADARIAAIEAVKKLATDYEQVRERIKKEIEGANQAAIGE